MRRHTYWRYLCKTRRLAGEGARLRDPCAKRAHGGVVTRRRSTRGGCVGALGEPRRNGGGELRALQAAGRDGATGGRFQEARALATRRLDCAARLMLAAEKRDATVLDLHRSHGTSNGILEHGLLAGGEGVESFLILLPGVVKLVDPLLSIFSGTIHHANGLSLVALILRTVLAGVEEVHQALEVALELEDPGLVLLAVVGDDLLCLLEGLVAGFRDFFFLYGRSALDDDGLDWYGMDWDGVGWDGVDWNSWNVVRHFVCYVKGSCWELRCLCRWLRCLVALAGL